MMRKLFTFVFLSCVFVSLNCLGGNSGTGKVFGFELGGAKESSMKRISELGFKLDKTTDINKDIVKMTFSGFIKIGNTKTAAKSDIVFYKNRLMTIYVMSKFSKADSGKFIDKWRENLSRNFNIHVSEKSHNYLIDGERITTSCFCGSDGVTRLTAEYQPFLHELKKSRTD